jgi:metal-responsive CopG/Arc/MetJ family transcriptional regulator
MSQLNIHVTEEFEQKLARFMELRGIATKSDAVRLAIKEAVANAEKRPQMSWDEFRDIANHFPQTPPEQWITEDELWGDDGR